ncbi:MAG: hypothetical protein ACM31C_14895 [Acidobacteriota bacterium]
MKNLRGYVVVGVVCALCALGCKKKASEPAAGSGSAGSGSAMMAGSGSAMAGSGSGSAMAGSGSAMAGSGSAMEGSGSAMAGSGSSAAAEPAAADPEGKRNWSCPKTCKLALKCKSATFKNEKECDQDCTSLAKDKNDRYARGSIESAAFYTCIAKAKDCDGIKKCDHHGK